MSNLKSFPVWRTADGKEMLIREMTDTHLLNAIGYLQKNSESARLKAIRALENQERVTSSPDFISDQDDVKEAMDHHLTIVATLKQVQKMTGREFMEVQSAYNDLGTEAVYRKLEIPSKW